MAGQEPLSIPSSEDRAAGIGLLLLCLAWIAALLVYSPALKAGWFNDDPDYVLNDPRLDHLELFWPSRWSDPPPALNTTVAGDQFLPAYQRPLIEDRFLWRLSFALERRVFGLSPGTAHTINLLLHLACIGALYWALACLLKLYPCSSPLWHLLPGVAALIFAAHPWAAEPVCYVSARNASLGTLFVLLGVICWSSAWLPTVSTPLRILRVVLAGICALAAFSAKENFITAPAAYLLVVWPLIWRRAMYWRWRKVLPAAATTLLVLCAVALAGIHYSERAAGLWAQTGLRGWRYLFEIQSPLVLLTLADQIPAARLSLETNHPAWPFWACVLALIVNASVIALSLRASLRWPVLLGLCWFYLHLLPTNSFLPRPDFLAMRNLYLPVVGTATLAAGALIALWLRWQSHTSPETPSPSLTRPPWWLAGPAVLLLYWSAQARGWACGFATPEVLWEHSAKIAPDHAAVRLNLACSIMNKTPKSADEASRQLASAEQEVAQGLAAEDSATMQFHSPRPRQVRRALALHLLARIHYARHQYREAARLYRESWTLQPTLPVWIGWAGMAQEAGQPDEVSAAVTEGLQRWPGDWWPQAMRGMLTASRTADASRIPPEAVRDLETAEHAPDAPTRELRSLQCLALYQLAQSTSAKTRAHELLKRLKRLGLPDKDCENLFWLLENQ
jgi:hypothetical protein